MENRNIAGKKNETNYPLVERIYNKVSQFRGKKLIFKEQFSKFRV